MYVHEHHDEAHVGAYPITVLNCQDWGRAFYPHNSNTSKASKVSGSCRCSYSTEHRTVTFEYIQPGHGAHNHPTLIASSFCRSRVAYPRTVKVSG